MPVRKEKLSWEQSLSLIDEHKIKFKGCVPPRQWPTKHAHHFRKIREISANRYEEYGLGNTTDRLLVKEQKQRAGDLCRRSYNLRDEIRTNESTWRELENSLFYRFEGDVICSTCRGQKWARPEYEAQPFNETEKVKLDEKRKDRKRCTCDGTDLRDRREVHRSDVFQTVVGKEITHNPGDNLERYRISMTPDRVFGLHMSDRYKERIGLYPRYLDHCPVKLNRLIHPFLVLEAKREFDAPGFRGIEVQTAFVIRRFLKSQDKLRREKGLDFDPLVWFFGFRGDIWRLYAGTLYEDEVHVYDLWMGTIESEDTAIQLFQIIDFIWSWARDVYRPQIKRGIRSYPPDMRDVSPSSTIPIRRSESVVVEASSRPSQALWGPIIESNVRDPEITQETLPKLLDGIDHPFHRLVHPVSFSTWVSQTAIRHSDMVSFAFHTLEIPNDETVIYGICEHLHENFLSIMGQNDYVIPLRRNQLRDLERYWTGTTEEILDADRHIDLTDPSSVIKAFIFFRTSFDRQDWQIRRDIYALVWSAEATSTLSTILETSFDHNFDEESLPIAHNSDLNHTFQQLRSISGRLSATYAYKNLSYILLGPNSHENRGLPLEWQLPGDNETVEPIVEQIYKLFEATSNRRALAQSYFHQTSRLLHINPANRIHDYDALPGSLSQIDYSYGNENGILALKPNHWPGRCPKFCLVIIMDVENVNKSRIGRWLNVVVPKTRWICLEGDSEPVTKEEKSILRNWVNYFNAS